ncbi:RNA polymerase sigma-70 factor [Algivirga pacifica]|uniref:RNA polymerase sigma factor n=1 Tax=Algivirga pacifica TaxID=1162670 RepID=A0ABP9D7A4_9BACT
MAATETLNREGLDVNTFKSLFDQYYASIRNFVYYKVGDAQVAEDLAQEVFLKVWEKRQEVKTDTVKTYLYTIANNLSINYLKRGTVAFNFAINPVNRKEETIESPEYEMELKEFDMQLQKAISDIPEKSREVFLMNRIEGLTYNEIADRLQVSVKAVEKRMKKALDILRSTIAYKI